ncbi:hypothetical protein CMZ82_07740 [Lysobacteraceae bacterium NML93-0792]|nr:hypothetical protein CMZ82_07740 [Xanthomonadaceae bacterium NML93-0792]PBS18402.1 hypothetical protein CMZ80_12325 [Xanthomonadaceae bacterium NML93-0831]
MNAVTMPAPAQGRLGAAMAALRVATTRRHRNWMLVVYVMLLAVACLLGIFIPGEASRTEGLAFFVMAANFSVWAGWLARLVLLQSQAAGLRAPGIAAAVRHALAVAATITVVLPAVALVALGVPAPTALGAAALGVLGGLLFALVPWPAAIALLALPAVAGALSPHLPSLTAPYRAAAVGLGVLVLIACWRNVLRSPDPDSIPAWRRPVMLQAPGGMVAWTDPQIAAAPDARRVHEGWLVAMPRPTRAGPHSARATVDALLAGPMGYVAPRTAARQWAVMALLVVAVLAIPFRGDTPLVRNALLIGGVVGLLAGGWTLAMRLERQRRRVSGELAELALLPGLGEPDTAAARLLRSVMGRLGQLMVFAAAGLMFVAWVRGTSWSHVALLTGMLAGIGAASVLMCLAALAGRRVASWRMFLVMLPLLVASTGTLMVTMIGIPVAPYAFAWALVWSVLALAYLAGAGVPLRRFRARPHAFLLD